MALSGEVFERGIRRYNRLKHETGLRRRMSDGEQRPLTPKDACEECQRLHNCVESARQAKSYLTNGVMTGYRSDKSRSRQYKRVRDQMNSNDNAERLARADCGCMRYRRTRGLQIPAVGSLRSVWT
jgi:hypothetical protein